MSLHSTSLNSTSKWLLSLSNFTSFAYLLFFLIVKVEQPKCLIKIHHYHNGVKAAVYISQSWCLSASVNYSDKGCPPKNGIALARWWERFGGKVVIWLGQANSFMLEFSAMLTTAESNDVCTWLFKMALTFMMLFTEKWRVSKHESVFFIPAFLKKNACGINTLKHVQETALENHQNY